MLEADGRSSDGEYAEMAESEGARAIREWASAGRRESESVRR
jgi:hypothetical protein